MRMDAFSPGIRSPLSLQMRLASPGEHGSKPLDRPAVIRLAFFEEPQLSIITPIAIICSSPETRSHWPQCAGRRTSPKKFGFLSIHDILAQEALPSASAHFHPAAPVTPLAAESPDRQTKPVARVST